MWPDWNSAFFQVAASSSVRAIVLAAGVGAALKAVATPRRYADVLVDMAETARRSRGRVAWQGVGVDGTGLLGQRIDRILRGEFIREVSRTRKIAIGLSCALALVLVVACRQPKPAPPPLEPDPQLTEQWARQKASSDEYKAAEAMTAAQVAEAEALLQKNPEDRETRRTLQVFYRFGSEKAIGWNERVAARRRHILWLVEHHPGDEKAVEWGPINPAYDPAGYAQAKALWLAATSGKGVATAVLGNAAYFFQNADRPLAEQFLLRAQAQDPGGPTPRVKDNVYYPSWSARLGSLYASAIVGYPPYQTAPAAPLPAGSDAERAFARHARTTLAETTDAALLVSAGQALIRGYWPQAADLVKALDFDPEQLGASYLERAAQLDPQKATSARSLLVWLAARQRGRRVAALLKDVPKDRQPEIILALPDAERIAVLPGLADTQNSRAEQAEHTQRDPAAAKVSWALTKTYAEDLLRLADKLPSDPSRGTAIFAAHVTLSILALHENDLASALTHMDAAGNAPPSEELRFGNHFYWQRLATGMLKRGERESVARFLDRYASVNESGREQLSTAAAQIRAGRMPSFYQYQTVTH
jgi:hypothetical protein